MRALTDAFTPLVILVSIALCVSIVRLAIKMSRGASGAGPLRREPVSPPGLRQTPWELVAIEQQLGSYDTINNQLLDTINQLIIAADLANQVGFLQPNSRRSDLEQVVSAIEQHLELGQLSGQGGTIQ